MFILSKEMVLYFGIEVCGRHGMLHLKLENSNITFGLMMIRLLILP